MDQKKVSYRWSNCVKGFNLPLSLSNDEAKIRIVPTENWQTTSLKDKQASLFDSQEIVKMYYITAEAVPHVEQQKTN
jgi:hypothetical protein